MKPTLRILVGATSAGTLSFAACVLHALTALAEPEAPAVEPSPVTSSVLKDANAPDPMAEDFIQKGEALKDRGGFGDLDAAQKDFALAEQRYRDLLHGTPSLRHAQSLWELADAQLAAGKCSAALPNLSSLTGELKDLSLHGTDVIGPCITAYVDLGAALVQSGRDLDTAKQIFNEAAKCFDRPEGKDQDLEFWHIRLLQEEAKLSAVEGNPNTSETQLRDAMKMLKAMQDPAFGPEERAGMNASLELQFGTLVVGTYARSGDPRLLPEAEQDLLDALKTAQTLQGPSNPQVADCLRILSCFYACRNDASAGDPDNCERYDQMFLAIEQPHLNDEDPLHRFWDLTEQAERGALSPALSPNLSPTGDPTQDKPEQIADNARTLAVRYFGQGSVQEIGAWGTMSLCARYANPPEGDLAIADMSKAVDLSWHSCQNAFAAMSETEQRLMIHEYRTEIDKLLSLHLQLGTLRTVPYRAVLRWKGTVYAHQQWIRSLRQSGDAQIVQIMNQIGASSREIDDAVYQPGAAPSDQEKAADKLQALGVQRDGLERKLEERAAEIGRDAPQSCDVPKLQAVLPPGVALVDILEYGQQIDPTPSRPMGEVRQSYVAFVVRCDSVVAVNLGDATPGPGFHDAAAIDAEIAKWRRYDTFAAGPGQNLESWIWEPLQPYLKGVKVTLISPDGGLASLPWGALPTGPKDPRPLIETMAFATVPVPQLLPELLHRGAAMTVTSPVASAADRSMLAIGDIAYNAGEKLSFDKVELDAVEKLFSTAGGRVQELRGNKATRSSFIALAPGFQWLYFIGHGFYVPADQNASAPDTTPQRMRDAQSAVGTLAAPLLGRLPEACSGLLLAGPESPKAAPAPATEASSAESRILTALQVEAMDLRRLLLVVLSGCETGLGDAAPGEGLLGLERAFELGGARSVVASLWSVGDESTQRLMTEFCRQMLQQHVQPLTALRRAQLKMIAANGAAGGAGGNRGFYPLDPGAVHQDENEPGTSTNVAAWGAWTISGYPGDLRAILNEISTPEAEPVTSNGSVISSIWITIGFLGASSLGGLTLWRRRRSRQHYA